MKGKIIVAILSMVLLAAVLVYCFNYDGNSQVITEGTFVAQGLTL